jgi:hypothetical protein
MQPRFAGIGALLSMLLDEGKKGIKIVLKFPVMRALQLSCFPASLIEQTLLQYEAAALATRESDS